MMSHRDQNFSAAVYVAVFAVLTIVCLILGLVLPAPFVIPRWFAWSALLASFIAVPILDRLAHRSRISESIRAAGGTVISIKREPFWRQPSTTWRPRTLSMARRIKYRVLYEDMLGVRRQTFCLSGWFHGVEWMSALPPEDSETNSTHNL